MHTCQFLYIHAVSTGTLLIEGINGNFLVLGSGKVVNKKEWRRDQSLQPVNFNPHRNTIHCTAATKGVGQS